MLSDPLIKIIFGISVATTLSSVTIISPSTKADDAFRLASYRIGQDKFSRNVKSNFNYQCCFPGCDISDNRFLVGSHIARWADKESFRGRTENGLCLCLFHDRAFEIGAFTLNDRLAVKLGDFVEATNWLMEKLSPWEGHSIKKAIAIQPSTRALQHHWLRHHFEIA